MKILNVVGARPNFVKMGPIMEALKSRPDSFEPILVHTGQHYDRALSDDFFRDLELPRPDIELNVGSGSHAQQTGQVMMLFEETCLEVKPDLVLVVGDVNSTLACSIAAKKLGINVAHVEAGLRCGNRSMAEEINRLCTDSISDYLFTPDPMAGENLLKEGIDKERIHFVGNVMIDSLFKYKEKADSLDYKSKLGLSNKEYGLVTLHRASNVDDASVLEGILGALREISDELPLILPIHPRTKKMVETYGLEKYLEYGDNVRGVWTAPPLGYLEFLHVMAGARLVLTDSGGIQEETTALGVPCLTLRNDTERPITCIQGTNSVVGTDSAVIVAAAKQVLGSSLAAKEPPEKWDGKTANRIVDVLSNSSTVAR